MTLVRLMNADGTFAADVEADPGTALLTVAQNAGMPLEGTCEGQMACSTCHVLVESASAPLPPPSEEEEDMLDFAWGATRRSRLACQLYAREDLAQIELKMPGGSVDMSR